MCHNAIFGLRSPIFDKRIANLLVYLDLRIGLPVALFPLVLFPAFLFEDDDLIVFAVAQNSSSESAGSCLSVGKQRLDLYLLIGLAFKAGHTESLAALDHKLFSACLNDRVTHFCSLR